MNHVICVLAFLGSIAVYCVLVLILSAVKSLFLTTESLNDEDFWFDVCFAQFAIALIVLALYFANMSMGAT